MVGFQLVINDRMLSGVLSNFRHASMFAFATGAMVLLMGATQSLIHEHKAIWLLYTVPQRLSDIMRKRAVFWWCIASLYATVVLVVGGVRSGGKVGEIIFMTFLVWAGTLALSFMAVGLGIVGTDLNAPTIQERMSVGIMYLYMLLAGFYAAAIYTPWAPVQIVILGIYALVAWGVWSWAKSKFPLLLDPA